MPRKRQETVVCQVCKKQKKLSEAKPAALVRQSIVDMIRVEHPDWSSEGFICIPDLDHYRARYVEHLLAKDKGDLTALETQVMKSMEEQELMSRNVNAEFERRLTFGERMADRMASGAGSWRFISIFGAVLFLWVVLNSVVLIQRPFDPYPFILLNLILSCLAAIQAPVIMMSQNRQEVKDRLRSEHDYRVNLKAELEIRSLHEKLDHLLMDQWQRLLEIQEMQVDLMEELGRSTAR